MPAVLLDAYQDWTCPACGLEQRTRPVPPNGSRMHLCPKMHGLTTPMVRAGSDCTLIAAERGDYVNRDTVTLGDDGIPYMNISTEYADGHNDLVVFAPCARVDMRAL